MNLFAQLAQQTFGETPAPVLPRLATRFENADAAPVLETEGSQGSVPFGHDVVSKAHASAEKLQGSASKAHASAEKAPAEVQAPLADAQRIPVVHSATQHTNGVNPADIHGPEQRIVVRQASIEPHLARATSAEAARPHAGYATPTIAPALPQAPAREYPMPQAAAPAPVIRVSIGRVEVRAIMRPQDPPRRERETPPAPSQTLDGYLRKGRG